MKNGQNQGPVEVFPLLEQGSKKKNVWFQFWEVNSFNKLRYLNRCLVGKLGEVMEKDMSISSLEDWAISLEVKKEYVIISSRRAMDSV